jgi:acyl-CoA thioester hydrolase
VIDEFRHLTHVPVRFRDIDAFGHVNNAVFSTYTEHARIRYLLDVLEVDPVGRMPLILGMIKVDFISPIMLRDSVEIGSRVDWIGRSSIAMSHLLRAQDERELARVTSILVAYDYAAAHPMPVPEEWRTKMASYEGRSLERPQGVA